VARGFGDRFALLQRPYGAWQQRPERAGLLTGDLDRFADEHWWLAQHPGWQLGGVTWGWLAAALDSIAAIAAPGALEAIANPVLLLVGARERLVAPAAVEAAAARIPNARFERIARARHELLRETDDLRAGVLAKLAAFLNIAA
jgi:lysophospholipase